MNSGQGVAIGVAAVAVVAVLGASLLFGPPQVATPSSGQTTVGTDTKATSSSSSTSTRSSAGGSSTSTNGTSTSGQCVTVGEPLFPYPESVPLQGFVQNMQAEYQVTVNETAHSVTIHNPAGGIGQAAASTLTLPIVAC